MKILVTSGGTKVPIDAVRDITNMSHGTFGAKICRSFLDHLANDVWYLGAKDGCRPLKTEVDFTAPDAEYCEVTPEDSSKINDFWNFFFWCQKVRNRLYEKQFRDYQDYAQSLETICRGDAPDIIVLAAAVSDYLVVNPAEGKVRSSESMTIELTPAEKLISKVKEWCPNTKLVGFKLLVGSTEAELIEKAKQSIKTNGCDLVVANDLEDIKNNAHKLILVKPTGNEFIIERVTSGNLAEAVAMAAMRLGGMG